MVTLIITAVAVAVIATGGLYYSSQKNKNISVPSIKKEVNSESTVKEDKTSTKVSIKNTESQFTGIIDGDIYLNTTAGFQFKIPKGYKIVEESWAGYDSIYQELGAYKAFGLVKFAKPVNSSNLKDLRNPSFTVKSSEFARSPDITIEEQAKMLVTFFKATGYNSMMLNGYSGAANPKGVSDITKGVSFSFSKQLENNQKLLIMLNYTGSYDFETSHLEAGVDQHFLSELSDFEVVESSYKKI